MRDVVVVSATLTRNFLGVTTRVTRYILLKVTPSVTSNFLPKLVAYMLSMFVQLTKV